MKPLVIKGGCIVDPSQGINRVSDMVLVGGTVAWIGERGAAPSIEDSMILLAQGLVICPGFIDLHCHLREPGQEQNETIATGTQAAANGGFAAVCCMPNTNPPVDSRAMINYISTKALDVGAVRVLPIGCITKGREGKCLTNMHELAQAGAIGFSDDGAPVMDTNLMRHALEHSGDIGLPLIEHCEDTSLSKQGAMNESRVAAKLGIKGIPAKAEECMVARDLSLAELTGARLHITHVSTEGSVRLIRQAKARGINVTADATPHHLTLTEERVMTHGTNAKVNPPLRTQKDVDTLIEGLGDGTIDAIATDHAPHTIAGKQGDFATAAFGISGLETAFGVLMGLVHDGKIDMVSLLAKLTCNPAKIIGPSRNRDRERDTCPTGDLMVDLARDITIFDPEVEWMVDPEAFVSKGKNSPWAGCVLKGRVVMTIANGEVVYRDSTINIVDCMN